MPEWAPIFGCALAMEAPTFLLGAARLFPALRNDRLFSATFLATRILMHIFLIAAYLVRHQWGPATLLSVAFPLHAMWFVTQVMNAAKSRIEDVRVATDGSKAGDAKARALQPPDLMSGGSSASSSEPVTPEDDRLDPLVSVKQGDIRSNTQYDIHLLRHALAEEQPLRIRALLAAASRGRYTQLAAKARGLYLEARTLAPTWRENVRNRVWGPLATANTTALRREVVVN
jgi:hypothetical protein